MTQQPTEGPRARYREQVRAEIARHAWAQVEESGSSALSLKSIAGMMGMTAPALYRYVASRDELLTQLILTAYTELAEVVEASADETDPDGRIVALARGVRAWATANPQRYLLIYGTPVPGYSAPPEATDLARRIFAPITAAFAERVGDPVSEQPPPQVLSQALALWTRLHGVLSLELSGHFEGMGVDAEAMSEREVTALLA